MGLLYFIFLGSLLALSSESNGVHFRDCGSKMGTIINVEVSGCEATDVYCPLIKNTNAAISITFVPHEATGNVTAVVHGRVGALDIPFSIPNSDACYNSNLLCPLVENASVTYTTSIPVLKMYPSVHVNVKWELKDDNNQDIVCTMIPCQIRSKKS